MLNKILMIASIIGFLGCIYVGYAVKNTSDMLAASVQREAIANAQWRADMLAAEKKSKIVEFRFHRDGDK